MRLRHPEDRGLVRFVANTRRRKGAKRSVVKDQRILSGIEAQTLVINAGHEFWKSARESGDSRQVLSFTESSILGVACQPTRLPSEKQSLRVLGALRKLHSEGVQEGRELLA